MVSCTSNHKYNYILKEEYTNYSSYKFESCGLRADYISYKFVFQENIYFFSDFWAAVVSSPLPCTTMRKDQCTLYLMIYSYDLNWQHAAIVDYNLITSNIITINHNANINSYLRNYLRLWLYFFLLTKISQSSITWCEQKNDRANSLWYCQEQFLS
jgi:hypothetical protein